LCRVDFATSASGYSYLGAAIELTLRPEFALAGSWGLSVAPNERSQPEPDARIAG
jgi:hypothetical protein